MLVKLKICQKDFKIIHKIIIAYQDGRMISASKNIELITQETGRRYY